MSDLKPAQRIPRLFKENEDLSPRISNAPSVRKYEAQEALSPLLNLALLASPAGAVSQALSYSPEAEAGFERAPSYIQKIADKLRKADTPLEAIRELLVREHGATLLPNGQAIVPTAPIRTVDQLPSYMNVIREKGIPGNASLKGGKTIVLTEGSSPAEDIANINHEAAHAEALREGLPFGGSRGSFKNRIGYENAPGEVLARSAEQQLLGIPLKDQLVSTLPMDYYTPTTNVVGLGAKPFALELPDEGLVASGMPESSKLVTRLQSLLTPYSHPSGANEIEYQLMSKGDRNKLKKAEMGLGETRILHGAGESFIKPDKPMFLTDSPDIANMYATERNRSGKSIIRPYVASNNIPTYLYDRTGNIARLNNAPDMGRTKEFLDIADKLAGDPDYPLVAFRGVEDVLPDLTTGYQNQWMLNNIDEALRKGVITPILGEYASGGQVKSNLQRYQESFPQRRAEANRQASVMSQPEGERWQPEYEVEPALEAPMVSPDDLLGTGIPTKLAMLAKAGLGNGALAALGAGVIKNKGGNWLSGSVEGALSGLKKTGVPFPEDEVSQPALNNWIDRQLTRYVKNEMATPEDPVRALAERGVLHVDPNTIPIRNLVHPSGEETRKLGVSEAAKRWENRSDRAIAFNPASDYQDFGHSNMTREHPWVAKLDPTTPMYRYNTGISTQDLGFNHLIDELSNAINPESGLPRHLQLDPKSLERVSVPQAVERVHGINLWRAALKAEADQAKANNAATVLHKEYPEKGMKWVELRQPELPEGWRQEKDALTVDRLYGPNGEDTLPGNYNDPRLSALKDALKYEGDTMGHCVGGYCDDVASGRSRIYSLRDAKGQPHVTVEVAPQPYEGFDPHGDWDKLPEELQEALMKDHGTGNVGWTAKIKKDPRVVAWETENIPRTPDRIVQIKGKQNRAPNPEYLPFVQDFVKSGKWSDVGDLQNTGLRRARDVWNDMEQQRIREAGKEFGEYLSPEELKAINSEVWPGDSTYNFAHGGPVQPNKTLTLQDLSAIISALESGNQHA